VLNRLGFLKNSVFTHNQVGIEGSEAIRDNRAYCEKGRIIAVAPCWE
jgi:hypothetical protein